MNSNGRLPKSFFEKSRSNAPKNYLDEIIPFKWSNEKEIINGKFKNKVIIKLKENSSN